MALDRNRLLKLVKKLRKLVSQMDHQPPLEKVHALRTNTRRFEAMFGALSLDTHGASKTLLKNLGRLRKRAGRVRDMDVLTSYASGVHLLGEEECAVQLLGYLGAQRRKYAKKLRIEVRRLRPQVRAALKRTSRILTKCTRDNGRARDEVSVSATTTAVRLATQLGAPQRLSRENLHPYRLKVKELQNVLRMAAGDAPGFVDELGKVKDAIGEWHDWEELVAVARRSRNHANRCGRLAEFKRRAERKYEQALTLTEMLRKKYLRNSGPLKHGSSAGSPNTASGPVWEAIAMLAR